jgi:peptidoglycan/LPS O-acetylase OafA/YrhL
VLSIMFFHANATWFPGGGIGVDVFFVLSGFLITGLLLDERRATGRFRLGPFYLRRAQRLLPALLVLLGFLLVWSFVGGLGEQAAELRRGLLFTLGYAADIQVAYLGELPPFSLVAHMWSLAIEEQFYLVWPLLLAGLLALGVRIRTVLAVVLVAVAVVAVWRAHLWTGPADVGRVYYGPDTHSDGLLVGCALALVASRVPLPRTPLPALLGGAFLVGQIRLDNHLDGFSYEGGFVLTALAAAAVVAGIVGAPHGPIATVLGWRPLAAVGAISYGLYLWHWPVFIILNGSRVPLDWLPLQVLRFAVTFAVAATSYLLLERPVLEWGRRRRLAHVSGA